MNPKIQNLNSKKFPLIYLFSTDNISVFSLNDTDKMFVFKNGRLFAFNLIVKFDKNKKK